MKRNQNNTTIIDKKVIVEPRIGKIAHFELLMHLGQGRDGVAYKAINTILDEEVCVKISRNMSAHTVKAFEKEIQLYQRLPTHENIFNVYTSGESQLTIYSQNKAPV
jgi:serine/threonine protein kinase